MPWKETRVPNERMKLVVEYDKNEAESMAQLCRKYGISRKTGYKWWSRWQEEGLGGLADRSRAPLHHPQQVPLWEVQAILAARDRWGWGPKKLRVLLARKHPDINWPAISTFEQILKDQARVIPRKKRRRVPPQTQPLAHCDGPNALWCCDFKGHFATADGQRCYPCSRLHNGAPPGRGRHRRESNRHATA